MKKIFLTLIAIVGILLSSYATDLTGKRIYVNPGHGSFGPNDRPMATIPYPNLASTGMPDTCGFYETNTNLWKCQYLRDRLVAAGATVVMSREANGPWPYQKVNGEYPDYSWENYQNRSDYTMYNRNLSEICEEVEAGDFDLFISVHSNALSDGTSTNYPLWLYRGTDAAPDDFQQTCKQIGGTIWPYRFEMMAAGYDQASSFSLTNKNLRGDVTFMGSGSSSTRSNGQTYYGYYGVLKHGTVGGLYEGYFHTYQPARHRALNKDHCHMEGYGYYRGIIDYFGADQDTKGYILGTVKDLHEKMSHPLFNYSPKTNDQWVPCNGAVVKLYKAGVEIGEYTVDNNYNGVFYFGDLEPGNDYTLDATCEGYKPLFNEYKTPITVTANKVTYPLIYLESESYEAPKEVYTDYPEPEMPAYIQVASSYAMRQDFVNNMVSELSGKTIHRTLVKNDTTMFVLAFDQSNTASIYVINPTTHAIRHTVSTEGMTGSLRNVGDIALTADGVLLGCNYSENQFSDDYVNADSQTGVRGTFRVYKWEDLNATPTELFTSQYCCNWYGGNIGEVMTVSGSLDDFSLVTTCPTRSGSGVLRLAIFNVTEGQLVSTMRSQDPNGTPAMTLTNYGWHMQLKPSPLHEGAFVIIGSERGATEISFNGDATAPNYLGSTPFVADGATFFKYAKHVLMTVPKATGPELYDVTAGLAEATLIPTTNTTLSEAVNATRMTAAGVVCGTDITLYMQTDSTLSRFTTAAQEQPVVPHINAYNLSLSTNTSDSTYTFTYTANSAARSTNIVFYQDGKEVGKVAVAAANAGVNSAVVRWSDLPGYTGTTTTWAVELIGDNVPNWGKLFSDNSMLMSSTTRVFNAVDKSPESDYFGRIYIMRRADSSSSSDRPSNGLFAYNQDYTAINTTLLKGGCEFGNPTRLAVASDGYVYQADWADGYSGVYVINPADLNGSFTQFFQGTRNGAGVFTNNGTAVGSSTPGLGIYGSGENSKLVVYNEDASGTLPTNGLVIYNIGQADGSIAHSWGEAPNQVLPLTMQANTEGTPVPTSHGVFVSQVRSSGNNNTAAPSLMFVDYNGQMQMASCYEPYKDIIEGSDGGGYAVSADEKTLIMQGGRKQFYVFDIAWEGDKPVLTLRYEYEHGRQTIRQINFDYAGNLVCSGEAGLEVFTVPTDNNVTVVPAKKSLTVEKPFSGHVEAIVLDTDKVRIEKDSSVTLTATVLPKVAPEQGVTWSSSNDEVATVTDGVVTGVVSGVVTITATSVDGNYSATCHVEVFTPVSGVELDKSTDEILVGGTTTLTATVTPLDADNKSVVWTSSDNDIATVNDGVVSGVGVGTATITVTTVDGEFSASCEINVLKAPVPVTGVSLDQDSIEFVLGVEPSTVQLTATVSPDDADDKTVSWSSSNEAVATVADGLVSAVAEGEAVITVTTTDGSFTATCTVNVIIVEDGLEAIAIDGVYYLNGTIYNSHRLQLNIYSASGQLVLSSDAGSIRCDGLPHGTYIVRSTQSAASIKFVR